jgi:hypothetical protein
MSCRHFVAALAACAVPAMPAVLPAQAFEGTVTYAMNPSSGKPGQLVYRVKGSRIRADISGVSGSPAGGMYMLMDAKSGTMMSVMPAQKMYMTMDMKAMAERMKQHRGHGQPARGKITPTGKTETVAGHKCEHYLVGEQQDQDICAAKGFGMFMAGSGAGMGGGRGLWGGLPPGLEEYEKFAKDGFLPLRITSLRHGTQEVVLEAKSIERKSLDAALFDVPAGFQAMDMGRMMQQAHPAPRQPGG